MEDPKSDEVAEATKAAEQVQAKMNLQALLIEPTLTKRLCPSSSTACRR